MTCLCIHCLTPTCICNDLSLYSLSNPYLLLNDLLKTTIALLLIILFHMKRFADNHNVKMLFRLIRECA